SMSALDNITEKKLALALKENLADTTTIVISQRVSSLKFCDRIAVLSNGKLIACGTHSDLILSSVDYQNIYNSQNMEETL
ncbi:MAG: ABC transporter ATP-binding protein, partial [Clostridia bacterium]